MKNIVIKGLEDGDLSKYSIKKLGCIEGGKTGGSKNAASGHISALGKANGKKNANHPNSIAAAKILGQKNVDNKFWENLTFEQRSRGGKISGKKRAQMDDFHALQCKAGQNSAKKRVEIFNNKKLKVLSLIKNKRFITSEAKVACTKLEYGGDFWQKFLRDKTLVKQLHKGKNQFDPSIYEKLK